MGMRVRIRPKQGERALMHVTKYGRVFVNISNGGAWRKYERRGLIAEVAAAVFSHEAIHLVLSTISETASTKLDEFWSESSRWDKYLHGLGNLYSL